MNRLRKQRSGAVAVEFAITAPILILFLFAAIEFGLANMMFHTTEAAAYEGARVGIIPGTTAQQVETEVRRVLQTASVRNATISIVPANLAVVTDTVAVTVSVDFAANTSLIPKFFVPNAPFVRTCVLNRETLN